MSFQIIAIWNLLIALLACWWQERSQKTYLGEVGGRGNVSISLQKVKL